MLPLILASTSPFRAELLTRLQMPFETFAPDIDETPLAGETPESMILRLTESKADTARKQFPNHLIIASDQCATCDGDIIGKPGTHAHAVKQLRRFSGKNITFLTGLCLLNTATGRIQTDCVPFVVQFRPLTEQKIEDYLRLEKPYQCAGSFKSEGLGITLFAKMSGEDPNALIGLPLIRLTSFLANEGLNLPTRHPLK
ncbi:MAG: septum formation inhibitor Maf [Thiothrix sp.]|nr:MAG: septum formation inhibitor Maf [Thiothrix sp.]